MVHEDLLKEALEFGAANASLVEAADIIFNEDFRKQCEQNACGAYNKNWMCPPAVGSIRDLIKRVLTFEQGLVIQTVHPLEDSYDWEGMLEGQSKHDKIFRRILGQAERRKISPDILPLSAGPCLHCAKCAYPAGKDCYFPAQAISSVEAHGIDVMALLKSCGIPYSNGPHTVSYVGLLLFKKTRRIEPAMCLERLEEELDDGNQ